MSLKKRETQEVSRRSRVQWREKKGEKNGMRAQTVFLLN